MAVNVKIKNASVDKTMTTSILNEGCHCGFGDLSSALGTRFCMINIRELRELTTSVMH